MKNYSISLARCDAENIELDPFLEIFNFLEIGGGAFAALPDNARLRGNIHSVTNLFSSSLLRQLLSQNQSIIRDFKSQLAQTMRKLHAFGVKNTALNFPVDEIINNSAYAEKLSALLRECAGSFHEYNLTMSLILRVPSAYWSEENLKKLLDFKRNSMCYYLGFELDIFVHEASSKEIDANKMLRYLRFDLNAVRFVYEADTGNQLVAGNVDFWIKALKKCHYNKNIFCCPACGTAQCALEEAHNFEELAKNL